MDFQDKNLTCKDCGKEFVWASGEQQFYADKGLQNPPGRCQDCRKQKKDQKTNRQMFSIICKECGKEGQVPFQPRNPNDVLCADCFAASKATVEPKESKESTEPKEQKEPEASADQKTPDLPVEG